MSCCCPVQLETACGLVMHGRLTILCFGLDALHSSHFAMWKRKKIIFCTRLLNYTLFSCTDDQACLRFDHTQKLGLIIIYATNLLHPSGHASEVRNMAANYSNSGQAIETL